MAFVVVYDACVLYPASLRDLLSRLVNTGVVRARWSVTILDECLRNILENRPDLKPESLERTRELMTQAVPDGACRTIVRVQTTCDPRQQSRRWQPTPKERNRK
jgi:hypothetical protein